MDTFLKVCQCIQVFSFHFFQIIQDNFGDFIKSYNQWSGGIVLTSDTSSGSIINKNPQHLWDYNLNNFDHRQFASWN